MLCGSQGFLLADRCNPSLDGILEGVLKLIEFCGLVGTIIIDEDGIYEPRHPNDRLLLG